MKHAGLKASKSKQSMLLIRRKKRVRKKISGTADRPRLSVFRGQKHVFVQIIDDQAGKTLASCSSFEKELRTSRATVEYAKKIGLKLAERCKAQNINKVVFDRNGSRYHGRIKAVAEGAREGGLEF